MAEIPVEKKTSSSWWIWVLVLVVLAALAWWLVEANDDDDVDTTALTPVATQVAADEPVAPYADMPNADRIIDVAMLSTSQITGMIGRQVHLEGVPVQSLAGDMAFYIGSSEADRTFVAFDEVQTPGTAMEGKVDVNPGSRVDIDGVVRAASEPLPSGANVQLPAGATAYVFATDINVLK